MGEANPRFRAQKTLIYPSKPVATALEIYIGHGFLFPFVKIPTGIAPQNVSHISRQGRRTLVRCTCMATKGKNEMSGQEGQ